MMMIVNRQSGSIKIVLMGVANHPGFFDHAYQFRAEYIHAHALTNGYRNNRLVVGGVREHNLPAIRPFCSPPSSRRRAARFFPPST